MKISNQGLKFLTAREGSRTHAYHDSAGLLTIGVGHLLSQSELSSGKIEIGSQQVRWRDGLNEAQIAQLLHQDLSRVEQSIRRLVQVELNQNQYDALVSFVFNIGVRAFTHSTLLKRLNAGHFEQVPPQMRRWKYIARRESTGLMNRRELEVRLWSS